MSEATTTEDLAVLDEAPVNDPPRQRTAPAADPAPAPAPLLDIDGAEGSTADPFPDTSERPCWRVYDEWIERNGRKLRPGTYHHGMTKETERAPSAPVDTWICGPLHVQALTANTEDGDHGRLLRWKNVSGNWRQWAMPMELMAGDGAEVLAALLRDGLALERKMRARVLDYINSQQPRQRMRAASSTGWHAGAFVLPDQVLGADDIWFQASERTAPYGSAGTLQGWQSEVAALAVGNPMLALGISAALAGVLLEPLNIDGAGLHLFGDSSKGKTTILTAATSVWGGAQFRRTWRTTSNGLEGAARMHSGTLLALDEVGEVAPKDLYESAYALVNGHGKTRANVRGEARHVARWRTFVFSTGEVTIASRMAAGGFEAKAGQSLRLLDVPITGKHGAWDALHGRASGAALSDALRDGAARHYGHAGPAFVRALLDALAQGLDLPERLQAIQARMAATDGQETRGARVFALCALAGELAAGAGIVPWKAGCAAQAALHGFGLWRGQRGTGGRSAEDAAILRAVGDFIDRHGSSRFESMSAADAPRAVVNRAGYVSTSPSGTVYLFTSGGLREAAQGYDLARVLAALDTAGAFAKRGANGKTAATTRTPDGRTPRLYHVQPDRLMGAEEAEK
ncbi:putative DNA primase/helicase [Oryzisolibacter propanilivorax]|uniref:Putative DNA primase/helicase n=1 Tax=Oryzisolibacter propanilivorax TaxID=1527607 RepID=A0A1G9TYW9_9BURK|nr:DUF927 domain-containing protein [Oryzisolibacter propanilivorax]SDM52818.1 putative DNA primase/helicase [Oryzisolibacter propanilivorax]